MIGLLPLMLLNLFIALFKAACINIFQASITYVCIFVYQLTALTFDVLLPHVSVMLDLEAAER